MSLQPPSPDIGWQQGLAALFVFLSGGTLAAFVLLVLLAALQGGVAAVPFGLRLAPFLVVPAVIPLLLAGPLLLTKRWLRLSHFLAAGGACGAVSNYAWLMLTGGVKAVQGSPGLLVLAFFAGVAGGAGAWAYLRLKGYVPFRATA